MHVDLTIRLAEPNRAQRRVAVVASIAVALTLGCREPTSTPTKPAADVARDLGIQAETWTYSVLGNLGVPGNVLFGTSAVNDSGQIAGVGVHPLGPIVAWRWHAGVFKTTLPLDSTWVVGTASTATVTFSESGAAT